MAEEFYVRRFDEPLVLPSETKFKTQKEYDEWYQKILEEIVTDLEKSGFGWPIDG